MYPREIESDLSQYHQRDIADWHTGVMSSRKLLILLDGLPGESWFKLAVDRDVKRYQEEAEAAAAKAIQDRNKSELYRKVKGAK